MLAGEQPTIYGDGEQSRDLHISIMWFTEISWAPRHRRKRFQEK